MTPLCLLMSFLLQFVLASLFLGVTEPTPAQNQPEVVTACELLQNRDKYGGKLVQVSGRAHVEFEDFSLESAGCKSEYKYIWLEYGSGQNERPVTWCCGDLRSRDSVRVIRNEKFRQFHRLVTHQKSWCSWCGKHRLDVTLVGRFDVAADGESVGPLGGFGHFGIARQRIVIQRIVDFGSLTDEAEFQAGELAGFTKSPNEHIMNRRSLTACRAEGTVEDPSGSAIAGQFSPIIEIRTRTGIIGKKIAKNGRFSFRLAPGSYFYKATAESFQSVYGELEISSQRSCAPIRIVLHVGV